MNNCCRRLLAAVFVFTALGPAGTSSFSQPQQKQLAIEPSLITSPRPAETTAERDQRMKWWREARFGMFIHWGLYAVPAGEYKGQRSTRIGEWIMEWANIPQNGIREVCPTIQSGKV